jgi:hypothetical protein
MIDSRMGCCHVEITGTDGKQHCRTTDAPSSYEAAYDAIQHFCRLWWFDSGTAITVRRDDQSWNISQAHVREWVKRKWPPLGIRP